MASITLEQLKSIMPKCSEPDKWVDSLNQAMEKFEINTSARAAAFLAQLAHESGQLNRLVENLNYSAERLMQVWPKRFPSMDVAKRYERNPEKLANFVYASRLGNGDETSGDGWKYRGRGLIQVTGRSNYEAGAKALELPIDENPDLLTTSDPAAESAAHFWQSRGLNEIADAQTDASFVTITKRINGGTAGLAERQAFWKTAKSVLS
ncbi:MAG TPA: glycoside hydrolase family 19 protein [Blastocatellia bacterium]|nr:glycoside hydrolase family 19 protein [Blastocatellia bacterium]